MTKNIYWEEQNSIEWSEKFILLRDEGKLPTIDDLNTYTIIINKYKKK